MTLQELNKKLHNLPGVIRNLPPRIGKQAVLFTKQRFAAANWVDNNTEQWPKRKPVKHDKRPGRALLVNTGRLRNSIRVTKTTPNSVTIGTDVPYAGVHNNGFRGSINIPAHTRQRVIRTTVRGSFKGTAIKRKKATLELLANETTVKAHTRRVNMPRRRFIGNSAVLMKQINRLIMAEIGRVFK